MFKRVVKRVKRQEKEAELGITDEMKEVMGMQDTDSDESVDSDSEDEQTVAASKIAVSRKRKREEDEDSASPEENPSSVSDALDSISVRDALEFPVRDRSCVVCPGKVIKHDKMEQVHVDSAHHKRRMKRFKELAERLSSQFEDVYSDSAEILVQLMNEESSSNGLIEAEGLSKSEKKKQKREAKKEKKKASKLPSEKKVESKPSESSKPPKKKRKSQKKQAARVEHSS